jgi:hypothetical protein
MRNLDLPSKLVVQATAAFDPSSHLPGLNWTYKPSSYPPPFRSLFTSTKITFTHPSEYHNQSINQTKSNQISKCTPAIPPPLARSSLHSCLASAPATPAVPPHPAQSRSIMVVKRSSQPPPPPAAKRYTANRAEVSSAAIVMPPRLEHNAGRLAWETRSPVLC